MDEQEIQLRLEHEQRYGMPHAVSARNLSREAPKGWVGHHVAFRHVRSRLPVNIEEIGGNDGSRWFILTLGNLGSMREHILLAGHAFIGIGARARIIPTFRRSPAVHLLKRLDRPDDSRAVLLEPSAVDAFLAENVDVSSLPIVSWHPDEFWRAGSPIPIAMPGEWAPFIETAQFKSFQNSEAGIVGTEFEEDGQRHIGLELAEGRWTLEKIMEGGTAFIARGTPVEIHVDSTPAHGACVRIVHALDGRGGPGMVPLDEESIAAAIAPMAAKLRNGRPLRKDARVRNAKN